MHYLFQAQKCHPVIPAKAGIQFWIPHARLSKLPWVPAFAGTTMGQCSGFRQATKVTNIETECSPLFHS